MGGDSPTELMLVFRCYDRITGNPAQPKAVICGIICAARKLRIIKDWQVLQTANELASTIRPLLDSEASPITGNPGDKELLRKSGEIRGQTGRF
jgi:hypothetical protein